jgi:ABC-type enterochelin transport system substrate-binding protein
MLNKIIASLVCCAALLIIGCKNDSSAGKPQPLTAVDTSAAEAEFRSAPPAIRSSFDAAVNAMKNGNAEQAENSLRTLLSSGKLSPAQEQAARQLMNQVQQPR